MRIILWHGYLLGGTGSNIYTRALARAWSAAGHEVVVLSQDPHPERFDLGGARVVRPDIGGLLPTFVLDRYEGLEARYLQDFTDDEWAAYVEANAAAIRAELPADLVFANHVLPGGAVAAAAGAPFAVKAHGSELEFSIRGRPFLAERARQALAPAQAVFVGSDHIAACSRRSSATSSTCTRCRRASTWTSSGRSRVTRRSPTARGGAARPAEPGQRGERLPDEGNADRLAGFFASDEPTSSTSGSSCRPRA